MKEKEKKSYMYRKSKDGLIIGLFHVKVHHFDQEFQVEKYEEYGVLRVERDPTFPGVIYFVCRSLESRQSLERMILDGVLEIPFEDGHPHLSVMDLYTKTSASSVEISIPRFLSAGSLQTLLPPGMVLLYDWLNEEEESNLARMLEKGVWSDQQISNRRLQHFGYVFDYMTRKCNEDLRVEFPPYLTALQNKLQILREVPWDQATVNEYVVGAGISPHVETHSAFAENVVSISLLSDIVMNFHDGLQQRPSISLCLPRRSLLLLSGEARYRWKHGISFKKSDVLDGVLCPRSLRYSITFRSILHTPCTCSYPTLCDSQLSTIPKSWKSS